MESKVVVITGASSGIGWAVARLAAREGYRVVLFARRGERLRTLEQKIKEQGGEALVVVGDITLLEDQRRLVDETLQAYGRLDVLVNNAGLPLSTRFSDSSPEELRRQWDVNVTAMATLTRIALPHLRETKGTVVNIGSIISRIAIPAMGNYSPTKIAVAGLNDALRRELVPQGVQVCLVEPGPIATEFTQRSGGRPDERHFYHAPVSAAAQPIVRLFKHPRRRIVVPGWLTVPMKVGETLARTLTPLVDAAYIMRQRRKGK
jgi:short-subunit dehydrogenase